MPIQAQKCFTNICLLFCLNPRNIRLYTRALFIGLHIALRWLPHIYSWWFGSKSIFYIQFLFFFLAFKAKHVSKWYWLYDRNRISNKPMFYVLCFMFGTNKHTPWFYECLYNKARKVGAKSHPPLTLRSVEELYNSYSNALRIVGKWDLLVLHLIYW